MDRPEWRFVSRIIIVAAIAVLATAVMPGVVGTVYHNIGSLWFVRGRLHARDVLALGKAETFERMSLRWAQKGRATRARVNLARILIDLGRTGEAISMWHSASLPPDPFLSLELGQDLWQRGDTALALTYWERVPNLDILFAMRGMSHDASGDLNAALADYRTSWAINDRPHRAKARAFLNFCTILRRNGDIPLAITVCQRSRESGNTGWADMLLGMMYYAQQDFATAESYFSEAQCMNPLIPRADLWLGLVVAKQGRLSEAIQIYNRGVALAPNDGWLNFELGEALLEVGMKDDARVYLKRSIEFAPATDSWDSWYLEEARRLLDELQ